MAKIKTQARKEKMTESGHSHRLGPWALVVLMVTQLVRSDDPALRFPDAPLLSEDALFGAKLHAVAGINTARSMIVSNRSKDALAVHNN
jgi:hypothetical protein